MRLVDPELVEQGNHGRGVASKAGGATVGTPVPGPVGDHRAHRRGQAVDHPDPVRGGAGLPVKEDDGRAVPVVVDHGQRRGHDHPGKLPGQELGGRAKNGIGSTGVPFTRISKCRWGPVAKPVIPTRPMTSPAMTFWPGWTRSALWCPYRVANPDPSSMIVQLPYPLTTPATMTVPPAEAWIGVPVGAPKSIPVWTRTSP